MSQVQSRSLTVAGGEYDTSPPVGGARDLPNPLQAIHDLCNRGLYVQAFRLGQRLGPLETWRGAPALLLAGRLSTELGARRRGSAFSLRAARADPSSPAARLAAAGVLLERQGAAALWLRMREGEDDDSHAPPEVRAGWLVLRARVAAHFRDFEEAASLCRRAEAMDPARPATRVARAEILQAEDRHEDALTVTAGALQLDPWNRAVIQAHASVLQILGRTDEALNLLSNAAAVVESPLVTGHLAALLVEEGRFRQGLDTLDRCLALAPLLDRHTWRWLAARRSEALYGLGDLEGAREQAILAGDPFHLGVAERLALGGNDRRRVVLPVPFVQQHHKTCSPATLASLTAFFGRALDQSAVADEICYDGTANHRFRAWTAANGWVVREFRVTWGSACALLDRGIPFAVTTVWTSAAHRQAIVGYDACRGTLFIRCPSQPFLVELPADRFFGEYAWCGPRGAVILPPDRAPELDGIDLPDAALYDQLHTLKSHLVAHRRYEAGGVKQRLSTAAPGHALTRWAALELAWYDGDLEAQGAALDSLLELFPYSSALASMRLRVTRALAPPARSSRLFAEICTRHRHDLALQSQWASELTDHPAEHPRARRMASALLRLNHWPTEALNINTLANIAGHEGRVDEELELRRLAARLEDKAEGYAWAYFSAAKRRGRAREVLPFLDWRVRAYGRQSGAPVSTFVNALVKTGRGDEGCAALEKAIALRPGDPDLALFGARVLVEHGRLDRAEELLRAARGRTQRAEWHRASAQVKHRRGDLRAALESWSVVAVAEPESIDAHQAIANLLAATRGKGAALSYARAVSAPFPDRREFRAFRSGWERRFRSRPSPQASLAAEAAGAAPGEGNESTALWASYLVIAFVNFVVRPLVEAWLR